MPTAAHRGDERGAVAEAADEHAPSRRDILGWAIGVMAALCSLIVAVPIIGLLVAPALRARERREWTDLGPVDTLPIGQPRQLIAVVQQKDAWQDRTVRRAAWVVRTGAVTYAVFHARCTHLGCAYRWDGDKREFACPCHGGTYDLTGRVTGGPPPRSLETLPAKVESGKLYVRFI